MPCLPDIGNTKYICSTMNKNQMYPSFISMTPKVAVVQQTPISDAELYFAYFSLYILFPLLYNMLVAGNKSAVMVIWRYITSGVFDTVSQLNEMATDMFYATLRMFGQYNFSTYTVVKDGREVYSASSLFYYYKSDVKTVYHIDRAKYNVCKWIDNQCKLYSKIHGDEPEVHDMRNEIYDFILHKVDGQPYTRIHRGNFTGRTHTLITEHYRPYRNSYQFAPEAELTVYMNSTSVEPPLVSSDYTAETATATATANANTTANTNNDDDDTDSGSCFAPYVYKINLKTPRHFFLEKNEILDTNFLKWILYNEFGRESIAKYIRSPFYRYKLTLYYNECMKDYFKDETKTATVTTDEEPQITNIPQTRFKAYVLDHTQSVIVGHTYVVKVDSLLRCPVFESNEKQVLDIDGVLSSYYDCSDTDEGDSEGEGEGDDTDSECDREGDDTDTDTDSETEATHDSNETEPPAAAESESDDADFEVIQEHST